VITCDAPPMNELVGAARGMLVKASAAAPFNLVTRYQFDDAALEAAIERLMAMPENERILLGQQARAWFVSNEAAFADRLDAALRQVL
jgi:hypothetical protein